MKSYKQQIEAIKDAISLIEALREESRISGGPLDTKRISLNALRDGATTIQAVEMLEDKPTRSEPPLQVKQFSVNDGEPVTIAEFISDNFEVPAEYITAMMAMVVGERREFRRKLKGGEGIYIVKRTR